MDLIRFVSFWLGAIIILEWVQFIETVLLNGTVQIYLDDITVSPCVSCVFLYFLHKLTLMAEVVGRLRAFLSNGKNPLESQTITDTIAIIIIIIIIIVVLVVLFVSETKCTDHHLSRHL